MNPLLWIWNHQNWTLYIISRIKKAQNMLQLYKSLIICPVQHNINVWTQYTVNRIQQQNKYIQNDWRLPFPIRRTSSNTFKHVCFTLFAGHEDVTSTLLLMSKVDKYAISIDPRSIKRVFWDRSRKIHFTLRFNE